MIYSPEMPATIDGHHIVKLELARIWAKVLDVESVDFDQNYFDLGGDSSTAVQMFAQVEKAFEVKLPLATLYDAPTVEELALVLCGETSASRWSPLVEIHGSGSRIPLFCFHGAGGNVLNYQKLSQYLGPDQPFYGLQSQGLDGVAPLLTSVQEMAALYVKEIRRTQPRGPYLLAGYCMGGTVAYEAAQQLEASGEKVALLALLDTMNWHKIPLTVWSKSSYGCQKVLFHAASFFDLDRQGKIEYYGEKMDVLRTRLPVWRGVLRGLLDRKGASGNQDSRLLARIWKTNDRASWEYVPKPYAGTVLDVRPAKQYRVFSKPGLKWEQLAAGGQDVVVLPVYPASMLLEPFVKQLADVLKAAIDAVVEK